MFRGGEKFFDSLVGETPFVFLVFSPVGFFWGRKTPGLAAAKTVHAMTELNSVFFILNLFFSV